VFGNYTWPVAMMQRGSCAASGPCHRAVEAVQVHEASCCVARAVQLIITSDGGLSDASRVVVQLAGATQKAETRYPLCYDASA
jgi:hypothetical protein